MAKTAGKSGKKKAKKLVHHDIPRTAKIAKKMGFTPNAGTVSPHDLPAGQKKNWLLLSKTKAAGEICGVRPLPGGGVEVCYIDPATGECNDCHRSGG